MRLPTMREIHELAKKNFMESRLNGEVQKKILFKKGEGSKVQILLKMSESNHTDIDEESRRVKNESRKATNPKQAKLLDF